MIRMIWAIPIKWLERMKWKKVVYKPILVELPADGRDVFTDNILVNFDGDKVRVRRLSTDFYIQEKDLPTILNWYGIEKLWPAMGEFVYEENLWE